MVFRGGQAHSEGDGDFHVRFSLRQPDVDLRLAFGQAESLQPCAHALALKLSTTVYPTLSQMYPVVVVDPENTVKESDETNNVAVVGPLAP